MSFLKDPELQAAENVLRNYGRFIRGYKTKLRTAPKSEIREELLQLSFGEKNENISAFELLESDNRVLSKILLVFFHLGQEAKSLNNGSKEIAAKLIVIDDEIKTSDNNELTQAEATSNAIVRFSYALEDLLNMKFLIQNSIFLAVNVIHQYSALFSMEKFFQISPTASFPSNLDDVGLLFKNFMIFDAIFASSDYKTYLQLYGEMISGQEGQIDENSLRNLQNTLHEISLLLDGNIFQLAIDNLVTLKAKIKPSPLKKLENFILNYITSLINSTNMFDSSISELTDTDQVIKINVFIVIYQNLFGNFDAKNLRLVSEINNKHCAIPILNILWNGNEFLKKNVPLLYKSSLDVAKVQQAFMAQKVQSLTKDATAMYATQVRTHFRRLFRRKLK